MLQLDKAIQEIKIVRKLVQRVLTEEIRNSRHLNQKKLDKLNDIINAASECEAYLETVKSKIDFYRGIE